ncbi:MAG: DUF262 domain-containing protein [Chloroflexi bacterium]|nr:DUF262 domain-containing protein [Chloroflexota bacterium]
MSLFDSTKLPLKSILDQIVEGKIQLPDFQRGWIWDDEHIRSLLLSIARDFPIGSIMLLEAGGASRFQIRPVEGVELIAGTTKVERLILDGQQRLTSLIQVLRLNKPVKTRDSQKREVERFYYFSIEKALLGNSNLEEAIIGVDGSKTLRRNFGREVVLDLSTREMEFSQFYFPCNQILNSDVWEEGLMAYDQNKFPLYMRFRSSILNKFREYLVPLIELKKENTKEAVCLVFEKVNTGGVPLSVFELVTASYAADGFNLRDDWYGSAERNVEGRSRKLASRPLLKEIEPTDFLQGISLLNSYKVRLQDLAAGRSGKEVTAVSAKREQVLSLPLSAYQEWADKLVDGFVEAVRFLRMEGFRNPKYLPYRSQLVPLASVMTWLGERWLEPMIYDKIARWFWCGVFGELYGGAVETRIGLDMQDLLTWVQQPDGQEPATVVAAGFQPSRLDTLRTRTSAAYRGLYVLLQREGAKDIFWKARIVDLDYDDCAIDIHHIFPTAWFRRNGISNRVGNSIVNKTAISYKANRMIGGKAPSQYLEQLRTHPQVQASRVEQDEVLSSHLIDPSLLRADDFSGFYDRRKVELINIIEKAMGKAVIATASEVPPEDLDEDEGDE